MDNKRLKTITGIGIFTAIVIVLQLLGSFIKFGPFSISLVLIPIVVGSALYGPLAGGFLGFIFGVVVLMSGDAAAFLAINVPATILIVLLKGFLSGLGAGLVYKSFMNKNINLATILSAITCPIINTGIFLIGCFLFFMPTISSWASALGFPNVGNYIIFGLTGGNFLFELLTNVILSPVILRVIKLGNLD